MLYYVAVNILAPQMLKVNYRMVTNSYNIGYKWLQIIRVLLFFISCGQNAPYLLKIKKQMPVPENTGTGKLVLSGQCSKRSAQALN